MILRTVKAVPEYGKRKERRSTVGGKVGGGAPSPQATNDDENANKVCREPLVVNFELYRPRTGFFPQNKLNVLVRRFKLYYCEKFSDYKIVKRSRALTLKRQKWSLYLYRLIPQKRLCLLEEFKLHMLRLENGICP